MFGANKDLKITNDIPNLEPGIYNNFKLVKWEVGPVKKKDGSDGKSAIVLTFKGRYQKAGVEYIGEQQYVEWETDIAEKAQQLSDRMALLLLSLGVTREVVDSNNATTFAEYCNWVNTVLNDHKPNLDKNRVDFKVVGQVYNGQKRSSIPTYKTGSSFVKTGTKELRFSAMELSNNADYANFVPNTRKPDAEFEEESEEAFEE